MEYMSKDFVADSSGRIMFRTRTERQTDKQTKFQYDWWSMYGKRELKLTLYELQYMLAGRYSSSDG